MPPSAANNVPIRKPDWLPWGRPSPRQAALRFATFHLWSPLVRRFHAAPKIYRAQRIAPPWPGDAVPEAEGELLAAFRFYNRHWTTVDFAQDEYVYEVAGPCRIDPVGGWVILPGYGVLPESSPHGYGLGVPGLRSYLRPPALRLDAAVLLLDPFDTNHGHFLNDILGRLALFERRGVPRDLPVIISRRLAALPQWNEVVSGSPALRDRQWIVQDGPIEARRVIFGKTARHDRETDAGIVRLVGGCPPAAPGPGERIFLTRRGRRTFANLAEIEAEAEAAGLRVVDPGTLSFREQMALFAGASVLVGPHGSAFDNILFRLDAPLRVLEIFPPGFAPPFHCWQARNNGHAYRSLRVAGETTASSSAAEAADFHLDPGLFREAVRNFLAEENLHANTR